MLAAGIYDLGFTSLVLASPRWSCPARSAPSSGPPAGALSRRFVRAYARAAGHPVSPESLAWHQAVVCVRALVEVAGWVAAGTIDGRASHPWVIAGDAFAKRLTDLTGQTVRPRRPHRGRTVRTMRSDAAHWDDRYSTVGAEDVSWYEERPTVSLALLDALGIGSDASVIDIGGGASTLVDHLLARGHHDLAVLDLSVTALATARQRLADPDHVTWIDHDLLTWEPPRRWDIWHDRAVLHFLRNDHDRLAYVHQLRRTLAPGGAFIVGTFAEDGPTHCSGLEIRRHTPQDLIDLLGDIEIVDARRHVHRTPGGGEQPFNWIAGRLRPADAGVTS